MRLDEAQMGWAIGLAASQAGGFRATQGSMTAHFRPGHAARSGVWAALLAKNGFDGNEVALEADKGFFDVYATGADLAHAVEGLGERHELLNNAYKPYPCGIVIHPTIDACLELYAQFGESELPVRATLYVHPLALSLCGIREPATTLESLNSLYHWAAAALVRGQASILEMLPDCITEPRTAQLRSQIEVVTVDQMGSDQSRVEVTLASGRILQAQVLQARGSKSRPMNDDDLDTKFRLQAGRVLPSQSVELLRDLCRGASALQHAGQEISTALR
jgi:2-methylcitrate dehydratase PrpD